jgi:hypothetical protein
MGAATPTFKFDTYDKSVLNDIAGLIDLLTPTDAKHYKKNPRFKENFLEYLNVHDLLGKIEEEILYQRRLGDKIVKLSHDYEATVRRSGYYWICTYEEEKRINFVQICLYVAAENNIRGNILYPGKVLMSARERYRYWEVLNEDDAIDVAKYLMEIKVEK